MPTTPAGANSAVAEQYEKWIYPFPIADLSAPEVRAMRDGGDPEINWHTYWPNRPLRRDLDILIAGCGSNSAARYAFNHPKARIVGIDLSSASLKHEAFLKDKHKLTNLTLRQMRIEEVRTLGRDFDFIDTSGVLHHLPDPVAGLRALGEVLRPEGTIAVMVYGRFGRAGVYAMQELFRLLDLKQDETGVQVVKNTLAALPKRHVITDYLTRTRDTAYDAGLVDTFLHRQDRAYSAPECVGFAKDAGLSFMHWWDNILYYPEGQIDLSSDLYRRVAALPDESAWSFMELYNGTLGQHAFCVCRPDRPVSSYRIDFTGNAFLNYVPIARGQAVAPSTPLAPDWIAVQRTGFPVYSLNPATAGLYKQANGIRTIRECFAQSGLTAQSDAEMETICRAVFKYLWRTSHVHLKLPA